MRSKGHEGEKDSCARYLNPPISSNDEFQFRWIPHALEQRFGHSNLRALFFIVCHRDDEFSRVGFPFWHSFLLRLQMYPLGYKRRLFVASIHTDTNSLI